MTDRDIVICGAGPIGAACALFLRQLGIAAGRIALVDARTREAAAKDDRMIAISHGSATLLARIGAWHDGVERHATPITRIHISQRGRFGRTLIDRDDYGVPALGFVIRHGDLTHALDAALMRRDLDVMRPVRVIGVDCDGGRLRVATSRDGAQNPESDALAARYVVHAEGGLFGAVVGEAVGGLDAGRMDTQPRHAIHRDYHQTAITAFVMLAARPSPELAQTAFERFTAAGPIALLPARERETDGYALVWCGRPEEGDARLALDDAGFLDALHAAFGDRLGRFGTVGARRAFPLGLNAVERTARAHTTTNAEFAIGNAAQTLHPVAGQGLNLGLRDAYVLARLLAAADGDPALDAAALVTRFAAARRVDRAAIVGLTDFMPRVFANPLVPVAFARALTLALLDAAPPLRGAFARQMMNGRR